MCDMGYGSVMIEIMFFTSAGSSELRPLPELLEVV